MIENDEGLWEQAMREASGTERREGLWAKCFAEASGDEQKSKAAYIKARVEQLKSENAQNLQIEIEEQKRIDLEARKSKLSEKQLKWALEKKGICPSCKYVIDAQAEKCRYCQANFGMNSAWAIEPLSVEELIDLASNIDPDQEEPKLAVNLPHAENKTSKKTNSYLGYEGRINRKKYFFSLIFLAIASYIGEKIATNIQYSVGLLIIITSGIIGTMFAAKRLHDLNRTGWLQLAVLIPVVNLVLAIYLLFYKGTKGSNEYGLDPLDQ